MSVLFKSIVPVLSTYVWYRTIIMKIWFLFEKKLSKYNLRYGTSTGICTRNSTGPDKSFCAHIFISQIPSFEKMYTIYRIVVYQPLCRNFRKILQVDHNGLLDPVTIKYVKIDPQGYIPLNLFLTANQFHNLHKLGGHLNNDRCEIF